MGISAEDRVARINFIVQSLGADKVARDFRRLQYRLETLENINRKVGASFKVSKDDMRAANAEVSAQNAQIKTLRNNMLGFGLSVLFGAMAVKKFADTALKSIYKTYSTITENQTALGKGIMGLQASFEFIKFSIMEAFNSDVFIGFLDFIITITNSIGEFIAKHPGLARFIVTFLAIISVVSGLAMVLGQVSLLAVGLNAAFLPVVATILIFTTATALLVSIWTSDAPLIVKILESVGVALLAIVGLMVTFGKGQLVIQSIGKAFTWLATNPIVAVVLAFGLLFYGMQQVDKATGDWRSTWILTGLAVLKAIAYINDGMRLLIQASMMPFITMLNKAIRLSNEVFGTNFDTIDVSWDFDMANAIQEKIDEYVTVIDAYNSMTGQGAYDAGNIPTGADLGIDNFDYLNEETTKQTQLLAEQKASLDNLSGGANLQDIADLTAESNRLLEDAKQNKIDTQNIVDNSVNNINISANEVGADLLDRNALERLLDDYFKKKNQQTGVSMGY